ncbi:PIN/TRAM domain-containing protein [Nodosilinea sp. LEGE 06152]|uniref:PIN/TRAM domain-containing protein n=1 Tax=Nodosilinea sp. LEGE 06152 TaxID=2777966 RepID=UPI0018815463|nr:PIN/TRAM domain-containing protein [Nodosilinea sp. LEGE 06152]MBE9158474.1 PIN/TRAM domain-containing protein [Nodosilinea sp. LEGE 06152]MBE9160416.1 PIN/TRAM domain-containing protein [Nodosilinea sp. LEGE 06152]
MLDALIVFSFILAGAGIGFYSIDLLPEPILQQVTNIEALGTVTAVFGGLIGTGLGLVMQTSYRRLERQIKELPPDRILTRAVGLVLGLLIANLMLAPLFLLPIPAEFGFIKPMTAVLGSVLFAVSGMNLADTHGRSLLRLISPSTLESTLVAEGTLKPSKTKVLDTSCIIDGRIEGLLGTGFLEGQLLVPQFVLQELQQVADASNDQKRDRGRRGLDVLNRIRETYPNRLLINSVDYDDIPTVDAKLVKLAQELNAMLLTNDYNLNKVASFQDVEVLNINDLAQAIRPAYLPGDDIDLKILKEGKEPSQGVGYLNDGTMVVVEEGRDYIGEELEVVVTGSLQTSAGRMIFARPKTSMVAS